MKPTKRTGLAKLPPAVTTDMTRVDVSGKTFWLSFCDADRPKGQQFLGVAIVDVTPEMASDALIDVLFRFPLAQEGAEWIGAAVREAHRVGCNPGGEVASMDITDGPAERLALYPRNTLLSKADIEEIDRRAELLAVQKDKPKRKAKADPAVAK